MARYEDYFLVRESEDVNLDGEIWGLELKKSDGGVKTYGIAGADGQAEKARKEAEDKRAAAESARESAEAKRVQADAARAEAQSANDAKQAENDGEQEQNDLAQAKNNADQAANNAAARNMVPYTCGEGEYDPETLAPTIAEPTPGRLYLVPLPTNALDTLPLGDPLSPLAQAVAAGNAYVEWLFQNGEWEQVGVAQDQAASITTDQIDKVVAGEAQTGDEVLNLTGFSYVWARITTWANGMFAKVSHGHSAVTQSANGFMSAADKKKLDGVAAGANAYSLPTATGSVKGGVKLSDSTTSTSAAGSGVAATPAAVKAVRDLVSHVIVSAVKNYTLPTGGIELSIPISAPSGYKPIAINGFKAGSANARISYVLIDDGSAKMHIGNVGSEQTGRQAVVNVVCVRQ